KGISDLPYSLCLLLRALPEVIRCRRGSSARAAWCCARPPGRSCGPRCRRPAWPGRGGFCGRRGGGDRHGKCRPRRCSRGPPPTPPARLGRGGAVDDERGAEVEPDPPALAGQEAAGTEAGDGRRAERPAEPFFEELLEFQAGGRGVEAAGHRVNAIGLLGIDVGPVLVDDV